MYSDWFLANCCGSQPTVFRAKERAMPDPDPTSPAMETDRNRDLAKLRVAGVAGWTILATRCLCKRVIVLGTWRQLSPRIDYARRLAFVTAICRECGREKVMRYRLTTGRTRQRILPWLVLFGLLSSWLPVKRRWGNWLWRTLAGLTLWLERRARL